MTRGWIIAALLVVATNAAAVLPTARDRAEGSRTVAMIACAAHVTGGYGERDRLRLVIRPDTYGPVAGLDSAGLAAIGFSAGDIARLGDTLVTPRLPAARRAWARVVQRSDSIGMWEVAAVGPTREALGGDGLIVRARVGIGYETRTPEGLQVAAQVHGTEPSTLYLTAHQADVLRPLRGGADRCAGSRSVTLGNGRSGRVWVASVD